MKKISCFLYLLSLVHHSRKKCARAILPILFLPRRLYRRCYTHSNLRAYVARLIYTILILQTLDNKKEEGDERYVCSVALLAGKQNGHKRISPGIKGDMCSCIFLCPGCVLKNPYS